MKEKRKILTQHSAIFNYWKNKCINKDGSVVLEQYAEEGSVPVIKDAGEPMCWACSKPIITEREDSMPEIPNSRDYAWLWSSKEVKSGLNRCHIVPHAMDGKDTPQNLFLMCGNCHIESPDTKNREGFFRWVYRRRKGSVMGVIDPVNMVKKINTDLEDRGLPSILEIGKDCPDFFNGSEIYGFLEKNVGTHGAKVAASTYIVAVADFIERCYRDAMSTKST